MRMQITVDNLTTNKALAILSALETAEALHETDLNISVLPVGRSDRATAEAFTEALAVQSTDEPTDGQPAQRGKYPGYQPRPIVGVPVLGRVARSRLVPLAVAREMLGWKPGRLEYMVNIGSVESVIENHGNVRFHFLTPEQVNILKLAKSMGASHDRQRYSRRMLQNATLLWQQEHAA